MLENPAPATHERKRGGEASAVVSEFAAHGARIGTATPVAPPSLARGVRDDRKRAGVQSRVSARVPRIDAVKTEVNASGRDEQCRDQNAIVDRLKGERIPISSSARARSRAARRASAAIT
jgi:hypothetical protein